MGHTEAGKKNFRCFVCHNFDCPHPWPPDFLPCLRTKTVATHTIYGTRGHSWQQSAMDRADQLRTAFGWPSPDRPQGTTGASKSADGRFRPAAGPGQSALFARARSAHPREPDNQAVRPEKYAAL